MGLNAVIRILAVLLLLVGMDVALIRALLVAAMVCIVAQTVTFAICSKDNVFNRINIAKPSDHGLLMNLLQFLQMISVLMVLSAQATIRVVPFLAVVTVVVPMHKRHAVVINCTVAPMDTHVIFKRDSVYSKASTTNMYITGRHFDKRRSSHYQFPIQRVQMVPHALVLIHVAALCLVVMGVVLIRALLVAVMVSIAVLTVTRVTCQSSNVQVATNLILSFL